jgi:hypothetical protein
MCKGLSITDYTAENNTEVGDRENPPPRASHTLVDSLQLLITTLQEEVF